MIELYNRLLILIKTEDESNVCLIILWMKHFCIMKQHVTKFKISASFWDLLIKNDGEDEDYLS